MDRFDTVRWALGIAWCAAALAVLLAITYAAARALRRHSVIDVAWGFGFAVVAAVSFAWSSGHGNTATRVLLLVLPVSWGVRLGSYIGYRQRGAAEDPRYTDLLDRAQEKSPGVGRNVLAIRRIYLLQGVSMLSISMPVQVGMYLPRGPGGFAWAGLGVWVIGVFFEAVGDRQLARFKADPANKGRIMNRGLWAWTRHPNYFGDACAWWGVYLVVAAQWPGWVTVFAPLAMNLLLARGTGKATLERHMHDRPGFAEYVRSTSGFFPSPPPLTRAFNRLVAGRRS